VAVYPELVEGHTCTAKPFATKKAEVTLYKSGDINLLNEPLQIL
jgi:hypothetical protein